jgi:polysaccharide biosynthesis protein PslG
MHPHDTKRLGSRIRHCVLVVALAAVASVATAPAASARVPLRGVVLHSLWAQFSDSDMDRELDHAQAAGSSLVRVDVAWASLEVKGKGQISDWYLRRIDRFVTGANARGMKVLMTLWASPCWASRALPGVKAGCGQDWNQDSVIYPPSNPADFGDIEAWLTKRYGTKLAAVEVWNEPNLGIDMFWKAEDKAAAYASLVKGSYARAKFFGNPAVPIVIGGLVRPDIAFLNALYANGIKGNYDGVSIHPYGIELSSKKLNAFRAAQLSAGDSAPLWITEFGAPTSLNSGWKVTEAGQADAIKHDFGVLDALPYVSGASLYSLRDTSNDRYDFIGNFGVLRLDFSPKPGWAALLTALRWQPPTKKKQRVSCWTLRRSASARRRASKVNLRRCGLQKKRAKSRRR